MEEGTTVKKIISKVTNKARRGGLLGEEGRTPVKEPASLPEWWSIISAWEKSPQALFGLGQQKGVSFLGRRGGWVILKGRKGFAVANEKGSRGGKPLEELPGHSTRKEEFRKKEESQDQQNTGNDAASPTREKKIKRERKTNLPENAFPTSRSRKGMGWMAHVSNGAALVTGEKYRRPSLRREAPLAPGRARTYPS